MGPTTQAWARGQRTMQIAEGRERVAVLITVAISDMVIMPMPLLPPSLLSISLSIRKRS